MGDIVTVHLIRHEKTKANFERKYIGWTDESIVVDQNCVVPLQPNIVYGSDLKRCEETSKLYFPNATYYPLQSLREMNFGDFEMKTYEQLKSNELYRKWIDSPETMTPPNGESFHDFTSRVIAAFQQIVQKPGEYVFVVHGGVIRVLLSLFSPTNEPFQQVMASHRTIYTLQWSHLSKLQGGKRCESLLVEHITEKENL